MRNSQLYARFDEGGQGWPVLYSGLSSDWKSQGVLYRITSRENRREEIYFYHRKRWPEILGEVVDRINWNVHAYCQMANHPHLLAGSLFYS